MTVGFVVLFASLVLWAFGRVLARRRQNLLEFLQRPVYRLETFDEVVWGVPGGRLPESTSWVLVAVALLLFGGIGAVGLGLGLIVLVRVAPQILLPAIVCGWAARVGWQALGSQAGRVPVVRRLRLTQPHLLLDEVELGLHFAPDDVESAPAAGAVRAIAWSDVAWTEIDRRGRLVIGVRGHEPALLFGPLSDEVAAEIIAQIEGRCDLEGSEGAEVIDLARARLRALTERAERPPPDRTRD